MASETRSTHFIQQRIDADLEAGTYGGRVALRFPPEPNGFLHIGHAKSICLNFGLAEQYGGTCNLRFDDTNPLAEDTIYVESIERDVRWLGFTPSTVVFASDHFETLYGWAEALVERGLAYVDEQSLEEIRATRGTVTEAGTPSPWRDRPPAESLDLLRRMKAGEFADGARVLRAKIDMAHANMKLRDPVLYRIRHAHHHRTGDRWCLYPLYDWAHGQSDALERITHSLCTLEFEVNNPLYQWLLRAIGRETVGCDAFPQQIEFARLNLTYTVMSKRTLRRLVEEGHVDGWDDPRMPTIAGLRRRGVTPEAVRAFVDHVGVAKANSVVDVALLEHAIRDDLNHKAPRRMAVLDPVPLSVAGWPAGTVQDLVAPSFPHDVGLPGERVVPFDGEVVVERADVAVDPPKGFKRLAPGRVVRLRYGPCVHVDRVEVDGDGAVTHVHATLLPDTIGRNPEGTKVWATVHWVGRAQGLPAQVQLFDRLFRDPDPMGAEDVLEVLNPDSLVVAEALVEPAVADDAPGVRYQFERQAYVYRAPEDADRGLVFNRVVPLKDPWARAQQAEAPQAAATEAVVDPTANAEDQARIKAEARAAWFAEHPGAEARYGALVAAGAAEDAAWAVLTDPRLAALLDDALGAHEGHASVVNWLANGLAPQLGDEAAPPFGGAAIGQLAALVDAGTLSNALGRQVLEALLAGEGDDPEAIAQAHGWVVLNDEAALRATVSDVLAAHPAEADRLRGGEKRLLGFFIGQVMKATGGKADAQLVRQILSQG